MSLERILKPIQYSSQDLASTLRAELLSTTRTERGADAFPRVRSLGLRRSARLPVVAALSAELSVPILLLTDRTDRALTLADELALLAPEGVASVLSRAKPAVLRGSCLGRYHPPRPFGGD